MDPFPGILTLPDTLNPYLYTLNNPVNWADPSGMFPWLLLGIVGGAIGGIVFYLISTPREDWRPLDAAVYAAGGATIGGAITIPCAIARVIVKTEYHTKLHPFTKLGLSLPHFQIIVWLDKVKGSHRMLHIPFPWWKR
jgi:uncharacterized membrane protein YeaQ/YmgE (transglycosylase-associated protein family)